MKARWLPALVAGAMLVGCHQGEELDTLEKQVRRTDMLLAERQDQAAHLDERQAEADALLQMQKKLCPPASAAETEHVVSSLSAPAQVSSDAHGQFTVRGTGGLSAARSALERFGAEASYLALRSFDVSDDAWVARLSVWARCQPIPPAGLTEIHLPPRSDWIRRGPEGDRAQIARNLDQIHSLEKVLWSHPSVLQLPRLNKEVEFELERKARWDVVHGQTELVAGLLASGAPHHFAAQFDRDPIELEADVPLDAAKVGPRWEVHPGSRCDAAWCASAIASKDELKMDPVYEPMTQ